MVAQHHIDIVHAHEYKTDLLAWLLARRTGIVPLATAHGWTGQSPRERGLYYPIDKRLLGRFPRVIAVSGDIRDELLRHGARPERVTVILNAIDPKTFQRTNEVRDQMREGLGLTPDVTLIGAVGRLERQKRFDLLLEAFAPLAAAHPHLRLAIVGDGSLNAELRCHAARLGLGDRCLFLGHRDDVIALHHAFDLFVQSSEYEGTPNAVLEAMAMETPLVATDAGGTREIAVPGVHGLIVPIHDVPALTAALESAVEDPGTARTRAIAARQRIEQDLSFGVRTRRLESIYEELMEKVPAHA
jgi:glycosyltransferase involved in cell wall biosynthesis